MKTFLLSVLRLSLAITLSCLTLFVLYLGVGFAVSAQMSKMVGKTYYFKARSETEILGPDSIIARNR